MDFVTPDNLSLFGVALIPVIAGIVEASKALGMPVKFAPFLTGGLAVAALWLGQYLYQNPDAVSQVQFWFGALILFLSASGFYSVVKFGTERARGK